MTMMDYALRYANMGWKVLPCYEVNELGKCSCGKPDCQSPAKHPRTAHGLTEANTDQNIIKFWWTKWPNANIAIATGMASGVLVIDIDGQDGEKSIADKNLPPAFEVITGKGRHLYYSCPSDGVFKSGAGILKNVDSRCEGGYAIAPPSNHISGNQYEWRSPPWDDYLTACPDWWLDLLVERPKKKADHGATIVEGGRNNYLASYAGKLKRSGWTFDEILSACLIHNNKVCSPPLDDTEVEQVCRSISGYSVFTPEEEAQIERGDKITKILLENLEKERVAALKNPKKQVSKPIPPVSFVPGSGLVREVYDWIMETSRYPLPYLAMAASVSFVSTLIGRKFATHTNLRPNLYIIGLADSGAGKDHARSCISDLIISSGLGYLMGGSKIASGAGLVAAVEECPVKLYQIDEIGIMLQMLFDKNAGGHKKELAELMMELYTTKNYNGTDYGDRKLKKPVPILEPYLSIYGTSTPSEFYKALQSGATTSGFLNRMLFISDKKTDFFPDRFSKSPPSYLVDMVKDFYKTAHGEIDQYLTGSQLPTIELVSCPEEINASWNDFERNIDKMVHDEETKALYNRMPAAIMKLATVFTLSRGEKTLRTEDYAMARDIVVWSVATIVEGVLQHVADNEVERDAKMVENIIRKAGKEGISGSELYMKTRKIKKFDRDNIMSDLQNAHVIGVKTIESSGSKPVSMWVHRENVE